MAENEKKPLTEKDVEEVKKVVEEEVIKANSMTEKESEIYKKILEEAEAPVEIDDSKFELGKNELDIRKLSKKNKEQMHFRQSALLLTYLRAVSQSQVDIIRLLMIIADKLGIENIIQATDDIIEKQKEQHDSLKGIIKENKNDA